MIMEKESPVAEQAQKLAEVGAHLKESREAQSLTLAAISGKTKIQTRFLEAIESGSLEKLPAPVYTQGFIQRFAEVLGMNGSALAKAVWNPTKPEAQDQPPSTANPNRLSRPRRVSLVLGFLVLVALAGGSLAWYWSAYPPSTPASVPTEEQG